MQVETSESWRLLKLESGKLNFFLKLVEFDDLRVKILLDYTVWCP
jgi:hypothetical protein